MEKKPDLKKLVFSLVLSLKSSKILKSLRPIDLTGYGKRFYIYNAAASVGNRRALGYGVSFVSRELAILKCLGETVERLYSNWDPTKKVFFSSYNKLGRTAVRPSLYTGRKDIDSRRIGWLPGYNLTLGKNNLIPGQLVYRNYLKFNREIAFFPPTDIGSGVAAGFDGSSIILNGVYELIERDAFMTCYLNKVKPSRIEIGELEDRNLNSLVNKLKLERTTIMVFDITNDLGVPSFLTLINDRAKPIRDRGRTHSLLAAGLKSDLNIGSAVYGSIEEAFLEWTIKKDSLKGRYYSLNKTCRALLPVITYQDAIDLFSPENKTGCLGFLAAKTTDSEVEIKYLLDKLKKRGLEISYIDITPKNLGGINYFVYRTFIPSLQPLSFYKFDGLINAGRLRQVLKYFSS